MKYIKLKFLDKTKSFFFYLLKMGMAFFLHHVSVCRTKQDLLMKKVVLFLLSVLILAGCTHQNDVSDELLADDPNEEDETIEVIEELKFEDDKEIS